MEKYKGQSGIFKVDNYSNMLAFIGGDENNKSEISIGILNVNINGKKEVGLHFVKCKQKGNVNDHINDLDEIIDEKQPSFIFVPHSKKNIDFLIECLNKLIYIV